LIKNVWWVKIAEKDRCRRFDLVRTHLNRPSGAADPLLAVVNGTAVVVILKQLFSSRKPRSSS